MLRLETDCAPSSDFVVLHTLTQGLNLYGNNIGDDGMRYLADAFAKGALAQVTVFSIALNKITDAGLATLAHAITPVSAGGSGAMASLQQLLVDKGPLGSEHPALKAACDARGIDLIGL